MAKKKLKSAHIFDEGLPLKIAGIGLYCMKQTGGQFSRGFDFGGPQIFGHDAGSSPVFGPDIFMRKMVGGIRMMIDDYMDFKVLERFMVIRLGVDHNHPAVSSRFDVIDKG